MSSALIAAIATVFAGAGLKFFDWLVNRRTQRKILQEKIAKQEAEAKENTVQDMEERRTQILELREELRQVRLFIEAKEKEMLEWREKYWKLREEQVSTLIQVQELLSQVKELSEELQRERDKHV